MGVYLKYQSKKSWKGNSVVQGQPHYYCARGLGNLLITSELSFLACKLALGILQDHSEAQTRFLESNL